MATFYSSNAHRRSAGKDEPEELRQLRKEHAASLATLRELFTEWKEEDLLYALKDNGGDVDKTIDRISEGKQGAVRVFFPFSFGLCKPT